MRHTRCSLGGGLADRDTLLGVGKLADKTRWHLETRRYTVTVGLANKSRASGMAPWSYDKWLGLAISFHNGQHLLFPRPLWNLYLLLPPSPSSFYLHHFWFVFVSFFFCSVSFHPFAFLSHLSGGNMRWNWDVRWTGCGFVCPFGRRYGGNEFRLNKKTCLVEIVKMFLKIFVLFCFLSFEGIKVSMLTVCTVNGDPRYSWGWRLTSFSGENKSYIKTNDAWSFVIGYILANVRKIYLLADAHGSF